MEVVDRQLQRRQLPVPVEPVDAEHRQAGRQPSRRAMSAEAATAVAFCTALSIRRSLTRSTRMIVVKRARRPGSASPAISGSPRSLRPISSGTCTRV
jgi:hypothetical protein